VLTHRTYFLIHFPITSFSTNLFSLILFYIDKDQNDQGFEFDSNFVNEEAPQSKNQYGDTGSVKTFRDVCQDKLSIDSSEKDQSPAALFMDDIPDPPAIEKKLRSPIAPTA
jgi:hypothetical protein